MEKIPEEPGCLVQIISVLLIDGQEDQWTNLLLSANFISNAAQSYSWPTAFDTSFSFCNP